MRLKKVQKQGKDVKLLSFQYALAADHIIQWPIQGPNPVSAPGDYTY